MITERICNGKWCCEARTHTHANAHAHTHTHMHTHTHTKMIRSNPTRRKKLSLTEAYVKRKTFYSN